MNTVLWIIFIPFIAFFVGIFFMAYSRKYIARLQRRYGPPWLQPLYDIIKLMAKKTNISHGYMHDISVMMLLGGTLLTLYFLPVPNFHYFSKYGDMLVLMYLLLIPPLGMALGVGETANPNGSIGISRALMLLAGYDIPFVLSFIGLAMLNNSTSIYKIMINQQTGSFLNWHFFSHPCLGIAAFISLFGMMAEKPFEVFIAPQEIATGPMVEMGGKFLGIMFIQHAIAIFIELNIFIDLFLGGGGNWLFLLIKMFVIFTILISVNGVFGRFRIDDAMRFLWKIPVLFAIVGVIRVIV